MYSKLISRLCSLNISVLGVGEQGFWEGRVNNNEGMFPSNFVQEVKLRRKGMKKLILLSKEDNNKQVLYSCLFMKIKRINYLKM